MTINQKLKIRYSMTFSLSKYVIGTWILLMLSVSLPKKKRRLSETQHQIMRENQATFAREEWNTVVLC
jgi:hypothetical protein